jgi:predicted negative regulator of RcsB-dependent stress response
MAKHLDLEEQEQLDEIKHFWKQYGNAITTVLLVVLTSIAGWNGYQYWMRTQSVQAAAMFDEVDRVVRTGDMEKTLRAFSDMKDKFGSTAYAQQAGLMVAKSFAEGGRIDDAKTALAWVMEKSSDRGYSMIARLRLAGLLVDLKAYDDALGLLKMEATAPFTGLVADRRGDIFALTGKKPEAIREYQAALQTLAAQSEYRQLIEVKLHALGGAVLEKVGQAGGAPKTSESK